MYGLVRRQTEGKNRNFVLNDKNIFNMEWIENNDGLSAL
jgi:hypothetical protein